MKPQIILGYSSIFDGPRPNFNDLVREIPSKICIAIIGTLSNILSQKGDNIHTQRFLYQSLSINFDTNTNHHIITKLALHKTIHSDFTLFGHRYFVEFINREYTNYRDIEISNTPEVNEYNIFIAYLVLVDEINEKDNAILQNALEQQNEKSNTFREMVWPHYIKQHEFSFQYDVIYEMSKSLAFLSYLETNGDYKQYLTNFLSKVDCATPYDYIGAIMGILKANFQKPINDNPVDGFIRLVVNDRDDIFFRSLSIDPIEIRGNPNKQLDYVGMKEKPLFKYNDNEYIVPYWDYLYNSIFNGLVFSFYRESGINEIFHQFGTFKSRIGIEFSEKFVFKNIMQKCFSKNKNDSLFYFDDDNNFNPDCYYRKGKRIYLFEFKDNLINRDIIHSGSYELIRNAIDIKFVENERRRAKGIYQLANCIQYLTQKNNIDKIDSRLVDVKVKNLIIYPIIVHTSNFFETPGINEYLNELFKQKINPIESHFKAIRPVTLINLHYFFENILTFSDNYLDLTNVIEDYIVFCERKRKRYLHAKDVESWFDSKPSFHEASKYNTKHLDYKRGKFITEVLKCFQITQS